MEMFAKTAFPIAAALAMHPYTHGDWGVDMRVCRALSETDGTRRRSWTGASAVGVARRCDARWLVVGARANIVLGVTAIVIMLAAAPANATFPGSTGQAVWSDTG